MSWAEIKAIREIGIRIYLEDAISVSNLNSNVDAEAEDKIEAEKEADWNLIWKPM